MSRTKSNVEFIKRNRKLDYDIKMYIYYQQNDANHITIRKMKPLTRQKA